MHENKNWIYIGADNSKGKWSKVGKTTKGLETRHTSSQNPDYFIHSAFNICGNVHKIESELLEHIESLPGVQRQHHVSTGSKSECFFVKPDKMAGLVETFIEDRFPSSVTYENSLHGGMSSYELDDKSQKGESQGSLGLSASNYFSGNNEEYETDLGGGHFYDHERGMEGYRDEDGNIEWKDYN